ncbi:endonuclease, partial [Streptomyces sp. NPDC059569]
GGGGGGGGGGVRAARGAAPPPPPRGRLALGEAALLSSLVAGTPAPEGFDPRRLRVQSRALAAKRTGVVAKIAPELPEILGEGFRPAFLAYAAHTPMRGGYRRDALDFAESLLIERRPEDSATRRRLTLWWRERAASRPPRRATCIFRVARAALAGR